MNNNNELTILAEDILDEASDIAMTVLGYAQKFRIQLGWHYLLDLTWILCKLKGLSVPSRIMDAGAGNGLLQFILAAAGHCVVSVDAFQRTAPQEAGACIQIRYSSAPSLKDTSYMAHQNVAHRAVDKALPRRSEIRTGEIEYHCANLDELSLLDSSEFDAVVSVSALEHNSPDNIPLIMSELRRTAKDGAPMLLTISTSAEGGIHRPSHSWLLTEKEIVAAYGIPEGYQTNFDDMPLLAAKLVASPRLRRWLPSFYYMGGANGMPWGVWAPQYLPVGLAICNARPFSGTCRRPPAA
ncbi:MAG: class I SAM-dependent methyltransferase [Desulfovibrio sp.]|jgi:2-polyprenyl-3-methyl-5-hydroxy-6-metoxy-1,4-benzoquinol methylase|nr:class I SAM-dependent methyltransferase [Desulfovibrio sp.]